MHRIQLIGAILLFATLAGCGAPGDKIADDLVASIDKLSAAINNSSDQASAQAAVDTFFSELDSYTARCKEKGGFMVSKSREQEMQNAGATAGLALMKAQELTGDDSLVQRFVEAMTKMDNP